MRTPTTRRSSARPLNALRCSAFIFTLIAAGTHGASAQETFSSGSQPNARLGSDTSVCNDSARITANEQRTHTTARLFPNVATATTEANFGRLLETTPGYVESSGGCYGQPSSVILFINDDHVAKANQLANEIFSGSGSPPSASPTRLAQGLPSGGYSGPSYGAGHPGPPGANCQKGAPGAYDPSQNPNCLERVPMLAPVLRATPLTGNAETNVVNRAPVPKATSGVAKPKTINGVPYEPFTLGAETGYFKADRPYYNSQGRITLKTPYTPSKLTIDLRIPGADRTLDAETDSGPATLAAKIQKLNKNKDGVVTSVVLRFDQFTKAPEYWTVTLVQSDTPAASPAAPTWRPY
jgi:hypothetical protein